MSDASKSITATVKWFKADKGYGFVSFVDGSGEAFLHSSALGSLGETVLTAGTIIVCDVAETAKGQQVSAVHSVTPAAPAEPKPKRESKPRRQRAPDSAEPQQEGAPIPADDRPRRPVLRELPKVPLSEELQGTVRWFNLDSQSGLIDPLGDEGGIGVYFDRATLRQCGLDILADGEDVRFVAQKGENGPFAVRVQLA